MAEATSEWMSELQSRPRPSKTVARDRNDSVSPPGCRVVERTGPDNLGPEKAGQGRAGQSVGVLVLGGEGAENNGKEKGKGCPNAAVEETMSKRKSKGG